MLVYYSTWYKNVSVGYIWHKLNICLLYRFISNSASISIILDIDKFAISAAFPIDIFPSLYLRVAKYVFLTG